MTVEQQAPGGQQEQQPEEPGTEQQKPPEGQQPETPKTYDEDYVKGIRREAAGARTENKNLKAELEQLKQAGMSADEKALAEAEGRGRSAASAEWGHRLARSEFNAQAARRNPEFDTAEALEFVDLSKFIGEDGNTDPAAIKSAVERLVPEPSNAPPSFDGGHREAPPKGASFSETIRKAAGRG